MGRKAKIKEESESEQELYHVEVIKAARVNEEAQWEYLVKWADYDSDVNSYEPEENVESCTRLLRSFWKHIDPKNSDQDYPVGYEVRATPEWIENEKRIFAGEIRKPDKKTDKKKSKKSQDNIIPSSQPSKGKGKAKQLSKTLSIDDSSDSDHIPLSALGKHVIPAGLKRIRSSESSEPGRGLGRPRKTMKIDGPSRLKAKAVARLNKELGSDEESDRSSPEVSLKIRLPRLEVKTSAPSAPAEQSKKKPQLKIDTKPSSLASSHKKKQAPEPPLSSSPDSLFTDEEEKPKEKRKSLAKTPTTPLTTVSEKAKARPGPSYKPAPKVKSMDVPRGGVASGIPAKQRIALGGSSTAPSKPLQARTTSLSGMSFSKKKSATSARLEAERTHSHSDRDVASPSIPKFSPSDTAQGPRGPNPDVFISDAANLTMSPIATDLHNDILVPDAVPGDHEWESYIQYPPGTSTEVDNFLADLNINPLPPVDTPDIQVDPTPITPSTPVKPVPSVIPVVPVKPAALGKIPKKFKWTGELFTDVADGKADRICEIMLSDATDHLPEGLRLTLCFASLDSLRFKKLHVVHDLDMVLPACAPVQQMAKLGPKEDSDMLALNKLLKYMETKQMFTYAEMVKDTVEIGLLLVFPSTLEALTRRFRVPDHLKTTNLFVAVLVPWLLTSEKYKKIKLQADESQLPQSLLEAEVAKPDPSGQRNQALRQALHLLRFPQWLYDHVVMGRAGRNRSFCIWHRSSDGNEQDPGLETRSLMTIMDHCKAKNAGLKADVRVVFVHVGSLATIRKLEALAERRSKRFEIQFITYGTHETVPPERWGVHEIYPLGGVVTFTPSAIMDTPFQVFTLIKQLEEHPLWSSFILPSVVGLVAKTVSGGANPSLLAEDDMYRDILDLLEEGAISLTQAPPLSRNPLEKHDPALEWAHWQISLMPQKSSGLLEECVKAFQVKYVNVQDSRLPSAVEAEVAREMLAMQLQPAIMDDYRRFVVIKGPRDNHIAWNKDGLEWVPVTGFSFKDDFFASN